ncbi:phosphate acetyltransferase [Helicobacter sp. CLO-3]|uniref:phosphate acetyltransferase n=1 Tax=unclassified Helicobacter TaxID=2593540 RepID=UPI0008D8D944|nr:MULTISPECIES: phosphate acetyltransferase [unclassified Helicobacter]OHU85204.1 phosphate acetyltransferase [Helicobacter sp. CLO-3]
MSFIENIKAQAKASKKTIVLPETSDIRTLEAAHIVLQEGFADIVLVGEEASIAAKIAESKKPLDISKARIISQNDGALLEEFVALLVKLRGHKGMDEAKARELLVNDALYFGVALVKSGRADGMVVGAINATPDVLRAALQIIGTAPDSKLVSSFFAMVVPDCAYGFNGTFLFSDCGLCQNPDSSELAQIALASAKSFRALTKQEPLVAMLSHSTYGSAKHADVDKVVEATKIARQAAPALALDGELQLDAAIVPSVGESKAKGSSVAGRANVLIFPDLDAGNIGYKLVQRLAKAEAYGPITQGMASPVNDLSRGCSAQDIVGVVAITALQATQE